MEITEKQREYQCIARRNGRCGAIEHKLGFDISVPISECNTCLAGGGIHNTSYHEYYKQTLLSNMKAKDLATYSVPVILTILGKHCTKEEAKERLPALAPVITAKYAIPIAQYLGIKEEIISLLDSLPEDKKAELIHQNLRWTEEIQQSFDEAEEVEHWNIFTKGWYFVTTVLGGKVVSDENLIYRNISCFGLDNKDPCPALKQSQFGGHYCGDCGCGDKKRTDLKKKLLYNKLRCPRKRKGFYNYTELTLNDQPLTIEKSNGSN